MQLKLLVYVIIKLLVTDLEICEYNFFYLHS
jgi:hypothetical protein